VRRPLTTIAATVAAVLIVAGGASAATLDRDPLFRSAQVVVDDGSVTALSGYADPGGDRLRVAVRAASAGRARQPPRRIRARCRATRS
jgi:hypothetical protein